MPVKLTINGRTADAGPCAAGATLFDCAEQAGVQVPTSCRKNGKCKECVIEVTEGLALLSPPTERERHLKGRFRLSCQCRVVAADGEVQCHTMRRGRMRIERRALGLPVSHERIPLDPAVTRDGDRVRIDGETIARAGGPVHGIAMDLGTTTVVLRLLDLQTGELLADASFENPQRFGGSDVMSRIRYDEEQGGRLLRRTLAGYLSRAIADLPVDPATIYEMVVVGNSTMRDLFFGKSVHSIGQNPYQSITEIEMARGLRTSTSLTATGRACLLPIHPQARVYGLPIISGHVGADAAACLLAVGLADEDRTVAIMDVGTNTELIVGHRRRILAASCPAGPAFEGGAISCGMPALEGAIEDVAIDEAGRFRLGVIGDAPPQGLCGSGLVDLLSELLRTGRMTPLGRFTAGPGPIVLDAAHDVRFLESDVNELAQAKGAHAAGLRIVFNRFGLEFDDLDVFYLAGGFGRHLKVAAARRIGLVPDLPDSRFVQVGNAAIEGACIALLSSSRRRALEELVRRVEHCRLETDPAFFDHFVEGCQFRPLESGCAPRS
ncbi:MAG: DUF4445 domain-containing protein [Phycisphaerae bacterium]|jgi:uncharacterized 2Fe-2S/4Fe-4S cluster protein (DUF4445 family)